MIVFLKILFIFLGYITTSLIILYLIAGIPWIIIYFTGGNPENLAYLFGFSGLAGFLILVLAVVIATMVLQKVKYFKDGIELARQNRTISIICTFITMVIVSAILQRFS